MKINKVLSLIALAASAGICAYAQPEAPKVEDNQIPSETPRKLPPEAKAMILRDFDKDGDGYLNEEELAEARRFIEQRRERFLERQKAFAQSIIKEFDKDGDGKLGEDELLPFLIRQHQIFAELRMHLPEDVRARMQAERRARGEGRPEDGRRHMGPGNAGRHISPADGRGRIAPDAPNGRRMKQPQDGERRGPEMKDGRGPRGKEGRTDAPRRLPPPPIMPDDLNELAKPKA